MSRGQDGVVTGPPGQAEGLELLRLSAATDDAHVRKGPLGGTALAVTTLIVRGRRLVRAIFALLDDGQFDPEALILRRALMETAVTLQWLGTDLRANVPRWRLDDLLTRQKWDDELRASGQRLYEPQARQRLDADIERRQASGVKGMPPFRQRCEAIEPTWHATAYRALSHGATHPSPYALEDFIQDHPDGGKWVRADGPQTRDEDFPYEWAALWLHVILDVAAVTSGAFPWTREDLQPFADSIKAGIASRKG